MAIISAAELARMRQMERVLEWLRKKRMWVAMKCYQLGFPEWQEGGFDIDRAVRKLPQDPHNPAPNGTACVGFYKKGDRMFYQWWTVFWDSLSGQARAYVCVHEALHVVLKHPQRVVMKNGTKRNPTIWNIACDLSVNYICEATYKLTARPYGGINPYDYKWQSFGIDPRTQSTDEIYDKLIGLASRVQVDNDGTLTIDGKAMGKLDVTGSHQGWADLSEEEIETLDAIGEEAAAQPEDQHDYGGPGAGAGVCGELRDCLAIASDKSVSWDKVLEKFIGSIYQPVLAENWNGPARRMGSFWPDVILPQEDDADKISGKKVLWAVDASGSMQKETLQRGCEIFNGMPTDGLEKSLASWDGKYFPIPDNDWKKLKGGGGTILGCVTKAIAEMEEKPDVVIVFSDGDWYDSPKIEHPENWVFVIEGNTRKVPKESTLIEVGPSFAAQVRRSRQK